MRKLARTTVLLVAILVLAVWSWGCNKNTSNNTNPTGQQGFGPQPGGPPGRMPPDGPGGPRGQGGFGSPLKQNMMRMFGRNPQALKNALETSLNADVPAWDTIQTQTGELVKLSGSIIKGEPRKGSKESWNKLASALSAMCRDLDMAAQAKDLAGVLAASEKIGQSCKECHDQHKGGGPGGFGPPGPGGPGGPPGSRGFGPP